MRPEFVDSRQRGFGLVAALFLIIVIAGVVAVMARMAVTQTATGNLALQQARAYQAARAGIEWGVQRIAVPATPLCSALAPPFSIEGFQVQVECSSVARSLPEEGKQVTFHTVTATAQYLTVGSPDYTFRKLTAAVEREN